MGTTKPLVLLASLYIPTTTDHARALVVVLPLAKVALARCRCHLPREITIVPAPSSFNPLRCASCDRQGKPAPSFATSSSAATSCNDDCIYPLRRNSDDRGKSIATVSASKRSAEFWCDDLLTLALTASSNFRKFLVPEARTLASAQHTS